MKLTWVELMAEDAQLNSLFRLSHIQADIQSCCQHYRGGLHFTYITIVAGGLLQKKKKKKKKKKTASAEVTQCITINLRDKSGD
jgi:hypothetical protein